MEDFKGVLIVVSHDRRFMDKVASHLFVFEGEGVVKDFQGYVGDRFVVRAEAEGHTLDSDSFSIGNLLQVFHGLPGAQVGEARDR